VVRYLEIPASMASLWADLSLCLSDEKRGSQSAGNPVASRSVSSIELVFSTNIRCG